LLIQNRPYSTNDILLNLHKEHGKTAIQKAIDLLVVEGKVTEKVFVL
jgi:26S proteasome regulatory subunit (ATPase 3-interacting protein)